MHVRQLELLREWFKEYARGFYSPDPQIQEAISYKEKHTRQVCEKIVRLGRSLGLEEGDLLLAEAVALLHDVGRFVQLARYRTFNDRRSENHALLGVRELEASGVLRPLEEEERRLLKEAIEYHSLPELPDGLPERTALFARLIRDADKLDILENFTAALEKERSALNPLLYGGLDGSPDYSPALLESLLQGRCCRYDQLRTFNDRKLLMLSWLFDINFKHTMEEIARRQIVEKIVQTLPQGEEIRQLYRHLKGYMERFLAGRGS
ncbi:HD domain-containing protein [Desulfovirgula thermocuniculi]|uniref:HD domain-containing protein n=1 Tax=Desulfovirgula thermocuniculi TaxID=348842 RepID=UPI0003F9DCEA|nr:HD domain-containing protein [Desulfovirgula thermocuniculi]